MYHGLTRRSRHTSNTNCSPLGIGPRCYSTESKQICRGSLCTAFTHVDALWFVASEIVGSDFEVNPAAAYVLGVALLLHDAALTLAAYSDGLSGLQEEPQWRDTLVLEYRKTGVESPCEEKSREPPAEVFSVTVDSVLRARHACTSPKLRPTLGSIT
jgi:hypothetical protein